MKVICRLVVLTLTTIVSLGFTESAVAQYQRPYRTSDNYVRQILQRLETRTDRFSNLLPNALDQSRINGTQREDDINSLVTKFENATDVLKDRFNNHQSTIGDAEAVLREGARIDTFMRNHRFGTRTEKAWALIRTDLNRLANTYGVASNWRYMQWPVTGSHYLNYDNVFTGTFRLNTALSNNPRVVANNATRNLSYSERQRIYDNLIRRLTPPEMIAMDRHGNSATLASSLTPPVNLKVDGVERTETFPNGRSTRVSASFMGGKLKVISNGDRANDFTATFMPIDNGRRLLVTRQLYVERLGRRILAQSYYDRTSDSAAWNVYTVTPTYTGASSSNFLVPDGRRLTALLNTDLSTRNSRDGDFFTMRVSSPAEYRDAILEGHISAVDRGGRISGRSEMTFNFDRIRRSNGDSYQFAGIIRDINTHGGESARIDNEGAVREDENRTNTTLTRTGIGAAVGALIGAIAGGGKGAAIGAAVGAGAGAGSVYVQGRDDLNLMRGTEFSIEASSPLR